MKDDNYYVYIDWRLDTYEPFYVGMGHGDRWKDMHKRSEHFNRIKNKHGMAVEIVMNNLTEKQAKGIECWLINELVFNYGFSIDIPKNRSREKGCHLVNATWGGDGTSGNNSYENKTEEEMEIIRKKIGEKSIKSWNSKTKEEKEKINKKRSESHKGKNPFANKTEEELKEWKKNMSEAQKGKKLGSLHPLATAVVCLNTNEIFDTVTEASERYNVHTGNICRCCNGKYKSAGKLDNVSLVWMYYKDYLNIDEDTRQNKINEGKNSKSSKNNGYAKSVICLTTKKIFFTVREGAKYYKCDESSIGHCCKGYKMSNGKRIKVKSAGKLPDGQKLVWRYLVWKHNKKYRIKVNKEN